MNSTEQHTSKRKTKNHYVDIKLSALQNFVKAIGREVKGSDCLKK
jgi:hypothetical protein